MPKLFDFFRFRKHKQGLQTWALALHDRLARRAMSLTQDQALGLKDDFPLRFEVMILLVTHVLFQLHQQPDEENKVRMEVLWEVTFEGFEYSLRNRGVNDIRIASRMRKLFQEATGRRDAFLAALTAGDSLALRRAVARNVLGSAAVEDERVDRLLVAMAEDYNREGTSDG